MDKLISLMLTINGMDCNRIDDLKSVLGWIAVYMIIFLGFIVIMTIILVWVVM